MYDELLQKLKRGCNIMICEVDMPASNKQGEYDVDRKVPEVVIGY